jgi:hypothetical protein
MTARSASIILLTAGDGLEPYRGCLDALLAHWPAGVVELRMGFARAPMRLHYALGVLAADFRAPEHVPLPGGIERFRWSSPLGITVYAWSTAVPGPLALLGAVCRDVPVGTEYVVWVPDDTPVAPGWWQALDSLLQPGVDYAGPGRDVQGDRSPVAVRAARLAEIEPGSLQAAPGSANTPDAIERFLGELAHRFGWSRAAV